MSMARSDAFTTEICRLSYAQSLYKPRSQQEGGKLKYGCTLIFDLKHRPMLEQVATQFLASADWGMPRYGRFRWLDSALTDEEKRTHTLR